MPEQPKPEPNRAYSYLRFSTPEQRKGDSARRQSFMAADYAARNGLMLDSELTFQDLGVSAFRGQNAEAGRLADFLEAVKTGLVPRGSVLLVEQLDRLSRLTPRRALRVLEDIVDAGVTVVTLNDGRSYSAESLDTDHTDLMIAILTFMRANEESRTKSRRLKATWEHKRATIGEKRLTSRAPAWLTVGEDDAFHLVPERADLIRRIFQLAEAGVGQHRVAEILNREGIEPWGKAQHWQRSYISKILRNPAVVGILTPQTLEYEGNRKVRKPLEAVPGYYPAAISEELWANVQALLATARAPQRGRHSASAIQNVLAGLASCPICGGTATRVHKGSKSKPYLVCAKAKAGAGCTYKAVRYDRVEEALVRLLPGRLSDIPAGYNNDELEARLTSLEEEIDVLKAQARRKADDFTVTRSRTMAEELRSLESAIEDALLLKNEIIESRLNLSGPLVQNRTDTLARALTETALDRDAVNMAMRSVFSRVVVNYFDGTLDLHWTHGGAICAVPFAMPSDAAPLY